MEVSKDMWRSPERTLYDIVNLMEYPRKNLFSIRSVFFLFFSRCDCFYVRISAATVCCVINRLNFMSMVCVCVSVRRKSHSLFVCRSMNFIDFVRLFHHKSFASVFSSVMIDYGACSKGSDVFGWMFSFDPFLPMAATLADIWAICVRKKLFENRFFPI